MRDYGINKAVSIGSPLLIFFGLLFLFPFDDSTLWLILIVITHTLGYTHFVLGFWYQLGAIRRSKNNLHLQWFFLLTAMALAVSVGSVVTGQLAMLAVIAIGYFLFHGALNEVTVMEKQFGYAPQRSLMVPLGLYLLPFFLLSLSHPSFFFTPQLDFLNPPPEIAVNLLEQIVTLNVLEIAALVCLGLFSILVPLRLLWQGSIKAGVTILFVTALSAYSFLQVYPINYIVLYFLLLSYHFISWSFYFYQIYQQKFPERIPRYLRHHAVIVVPLVVLSVGASVSPVFSVPHDLVFNGVLFITFAMIHNTTSLLNETWFQNMILAKK